MKELVTHPIVRSARKRYQKISNYSTNKRDAFDKSVGQILRYACACITAGLSEDLSKNLRLFILTPEKSRDVEHICEFLRAQDINICHRHVPEEMIEFTKSVRQRAL